MFLEGITSHRQHFSEVSPQHCQRNGQRKWSRTNQIYRSGVIVLPLQTSGSTGVIVNTGNQVARDKNWI